MSRLMKRFGDKVILPMEIKSKEDLDKYHEVKREYEDMAIKLAEYEDKEEIKDCKYCCGEIIFLQMDVREFILMVTIN